MAWMEVPIGAQLLSNVSPEAVTRQVTEQENVYVTELGTLARFPGLTPIVTLPTPGPVYLEDWRGDLIAVTSGGLVYRIGSGGVIQHITGAAVVGGGRPTFAKTADELLIAAGGQIVRLAGERTEILSEQAPETSHIVFVSGYLVAIEPRSGRFRHSKPGQYTVWDDLDVFSAEGQPDDIVAAIATEFDELLLVGPQSIEQFDTSPSGTAPFFRRWSVGTGIYPDALYTLHNADNAVWGLSRKLEWVRISGQTSQPASGQIQREFEEVDDWSGAWATEVGIAGQRFQILQAPNATTRYGTIGRTWLYDYRQQRWSTLYGWDAGVNLPSRWPGWSHKFLDGKHYVGGDGVIYRLDPEISSNAGQIQRLLWRSGHLDSRAGYGMRVDNLRVRLKRGAVGPNDPVGQIAVRANRDNRGFSRAWRKSLGKMGQRNMVIEWGPMGVGDTWQFEIECTDGVPLEIMSVHADVTPIR
jgi:hypothetical protein